MAFEQEIIDLSSLGDNGASRRAAAAILDCKDPSGQIDRLYPALLKQQTLLTAMAHLERAGADLERLTLSASLFKNLFPLNILLPLVDHVSAERILLAAVRRQLDDHLLLLRRFGSDIADVSEQVVFLFGRAIEAAYPGYLHRMNYDVDVLTPDMESGLHLCNRLRERLGLIVLRCKISRLRPGWLAHFNCSTQSENGHILNIDIFVRGRPFGEGPGILPPFHPESLFSRVRRVEWSGRGISIPSAEDMLLTLAEKIHRHGWISRKDFNDAEFILNSDKEILDLDYLCKEAAHFQLGGLLYVLIGDAELRTGRRLVPHDVLARFAPGRLERKFLQFAQSPAGARPAGEPRRRSRRFLGQHWLKMWTLHVLSRHAMSSLQALWIAVLVFRDVVQRRLFEAELRLAKARAPAFLFFIMRTMRGGFGSVCELRRSKALSIDAFCVAQVAQTRLTRPRTDMDAESLHFLQQVSELVPVAADIERVISRLGQRGKMVQQRLSHNCSAYSFTIGKSPANPTLRGE